MAHFRGTISGSRGEASRLGTKASGMHVEAQSWGGKVVVRLYAVENGRDHAEVTLENHHGGGPVRPVVLYDGPVGGMFAPAPECAK